MNIILFNGPPSSGKDTAARHAYDHFNRTATFREAYFDRLSMPIKLAFAACYGGEVDTFGNNAAWEPVKNDPQEVLNGKSYRQWQIDFSESFMKPLYGIDVFAKLFCRRNRRLAETNAIILVPDCGFDIELEGLRRGFPNARILLIRIYRKDYDFSSDSRDYISVATATTNSVGCIDMTNGGTAEAWERKSLRTIQDWLK